MNKSIIEFDHATKYKDRFGERTFELQPISLNILLGDGVAVLGEDSPARRAFINLLSAVERPSSGFVHIADTNIGKLSAHQLADFRKSHVGFVFEQGSLVPTMTVLENVIPTGSFTRRDHIRERALKALRRSGLDGDPERYPSDLTPVETRRVGFARALITEPSLLIVENPGTVLGLAGRKALQDLIENLRREGLTVVAVGTNETLPLKSDRFFHCHDDRVTESDFPTPLSS